VKAVEAGTAPTTSIPMTGSFTGEAAAFRAARRTAARRGPRGKKVYGITEVGETRLCELIADPADINDDRAFNVKLAFCRFCDAETRLALLQRRRDALAVQLAERTPSKTVDRYRKALFEHDQESIERDIAWLDRLIETEEIS
jgi:hypothetical protein